VTRKPSMPIARRLHVRSRTEAAVRNSSAARARPSGNSADAIRLRTAPGLRSNASALADRQPSKRAVQSMVRDASASANAAAAGAFRVESISPERHACRGRDTRTAACSRLQGVLVTHCAQLPRRAAFCILGAVSVCGNWRGKRESGALLHGDILVTRFVERPCHRGSRVYH
jgi:hypothetical protein